MADVIANANATTRRVVTYVVPVQTVGRTMVTRAAKVYVCLLIFQKRDEFIYIVKTVVANKLIHPQPYVQTLTNARKTMGDVTANANAQTRWVAEPVVPVLLDGRTMVIKSAKVCS